MDYVTIRCRIDGLVPGESKELYYRIGEHQAAQMRLGPRPPPDNHFLVDEWYRDKERADALARYIAGELAHALVQAFSPE